jgi:RNA polymerase sigma-70 factor (ECF subfamily)
VNPSPVFVETTATVVGGIDVYKLSVRPGMGPSEFLEKLYAGDACLFEDTATRYHGLVRATLYQRSSQLTDIADLEQEVWLLVWIHRTEFRGRMDTEAAMDRAFRSWLRQLCRTTVARYARARRINLVACDGIDQFSQAADERVGIPDCLLSDDIDRLWDLVRALPRRRRAVFLLRVIDGQSVAETAKLLNCSENTVKTTLKAALAIVRDSAKRILCGG